MDKTQILYSFRFLDGKYKGKFVQRGAGDYYLGISKWWPSCLFSGTKITAEKIAGKIGNVEIVPIIITIGE
jgi:hypothetical protein